MNIHEAIDQLLEDEHYTEKEFYVISASMRSVNEWVTSAPDFKTAVYMSYIGAWPSWIEYILRAHKKQSDFDIDEYIQSQIVDSGVQIDIENELFVNKNSRYLFVLGADKKAVEKEYSKFRSHQ